MNEDNTIIRPELAKWEPTEADLYYKYENEVVVAQYDKIGMNESPLSIYYINMNHYKKKMADIVHHINYFLAFYDTDKSSFLATLSIKFIIDQNPGISQKAFRNLVLERIITDDFIRKCKQMSKDLYTININTDSSGKYKNTPKITNAQAQQIIALSFAFRIILPLCIHYKNIGTSFKYKEKTYYLDAYCKIFTKIISRFEENDVEVYIPLCKFIDYRAEKSYNNNRHIHYQKKQLRGDSLALYTDELIHRVIIVKSLYKLDYRMSCVSFIDGVINKYNTNYGRENYNNKPYEIDSNDSSNDSDDYLSRAEALDMQAYKIDESNVLISDVNIQNVIEEIKQNYHAIEFKDHELEFYNEHVVLNSITEFLMHSFYSKMFHDTYAIYSLNRETTILLLLYMKKIFQLSNMPLLSQITTATITSKYKENIIKNTKFIEGITQSPIYKSIISEKFKYIAEIDSKDDPILKMLSAIINCTFEFIDFNPNINGFVLTSVDNDDITNEFLEFLSIV